MIVDGRRVCENCGAPAAVRMDDDDLCARHAVYGPAHLAGEAYAAAQALASVVTLAAGSGFSDAEIHELVDCALAQQVELPMIPAIGPMARDLDAELAQLGNGEQS